MFLCAYFIVALPPDAHGSGMHNLPGFTRSVYETDHAVIAPESRVYGPLAGWSNATAAHVVTPHMGAHFVMSLVTMGSGARSASPAAGVERFVFVLTGSVSVAPAKAHRRQAPGEGERTLRAGGFAYFPPGDDGRIETERCDGATLIMYERHRVNAPPGSGEAHFLLGHADDMAPIPPGGGEVFVLRKLLPGTAAFDFNVHVMDFAPGEYLNIKEVHYNQHGMMLLQGQGIQRLGNKWCALQAGDAVLLAHIRAHTSIRTNRPIHVCRYPVQAGDVVWMAPMVPQWYHMPLIRPQACTNVCVCVCVCVLLRACVHVIAWMHARARASRYTLP